MDTLLELAIQIADALDAAHAEKSTELLTGPGVAMGTEVPPSGIARTGAG